MAFHHSNMWTTKNFIQRKTVIPNLNLEKDFANFTEFLFLGPLHGRLMSKQYAFTQNFPHSLQIMEQDSETPD